MTTRRIVTGHDADGRSVILEDGSAPHVRTLPGATFDEIWATGGAPERIGPVPDAEPTSGSPAIGPADAGGSVIRVIEFLPARSGGQRSPMHRTRTIDYGIVLDGEVVLILDEGEVSLRPGDIVVQRGTNHAWSNRSDEPCIFACLLIDATGNRHTDAAFK